MAKESMKTKWNNKIQKLKTWDKKIQFAMKQTGNNYY